MIRLFGLLFVITAAVAVAGVASAADVPDFERDVAPILNAYCAGCHNDEDAEGKFSLSSFAALKRGGENGAAFVAGKAADSRMIRMLTGQLEPAMPPEDNEAPTPKEIAVLTAWINGGAMGPTGVSPRRSKLMVPRVATVGKAIRAITAIDWSHDGRFIAIARFGELILLDGPNRRTQWRVTGLPGKVNSVRFAPDGQSLVVATGIAGLEGQARIYSTEGILIRTIFGHADTLYAATLSEDSSVLATGGYDKKIMLWETASGKLLRTLTGHNDAIYDLDFHPDSKLLASASGDETIKLWNVATGDRLDTRSEPLAEQYTVRFSPDGRLVLGGGADNRIRVWRVVSNDSVQNNPILYSRFAHEGAVVGLRFSHDGRALVSVAEDKTVKLWETETFTPTFVFDEQPDQVMSVAISPDAGRVLIGRADGKTQSFEVTPSQLEPTQSASHSVAVVANGAVVADGKLVETVEVEPNDKPDQAHVLELPATVTGVIQGDVESADMFRFSSKAGQQWIVETRAGRDKSPLDTFIEVLSSDGQPIERVLLRAVRDSYFTFRGKDSNTSDDYRVHNWREMELNEYIYSKGEVNRLHMYPRGPDSGFQVYPGSGSRYAYFDTTPNSHALHEPCYIVEPFAPGTQLLPNGLPVFKLYCQNDDEGFRKLGKDSRLTFTAPANGEYLVRVRDTRGFQGADYKYKLTVRAPRPDFKVSVGGANPKVAAGSGREIKFSVDRIDGYDGEVRIDISNLPPGFVATSPVVIQAGQVSAFATINAVADAKALAEDVAKQTKVVATAEINGQHVTHQVAHLGKIELEEKPSLIVQLLPADQSVVVKNVPGETLELEIKPGQTIQAKVKVERNGFAGRIEFGKADAGRNLPHGLYVDNIGLNGLMIVEGQSERDFYITAAKWVPETSRLFYLKASAQGGRTSTPVIIHVRSAKSVARN